jgi:hypothetical protein
MTPPPPCEPFCIDLEQVQQYLEILFPDMYINDKQHICIFTPNTKKHFYFNTIDEVLDWIKTQDPELTFYCQVFTSHKEAASKNNNWKPTNRIPVTTSSLYFEADFKCFPNKSMEEALAFIYSKKLKPSLVVFSGGGLHGYIKLSEPYEIKKPGDREFIEDLNKRLANYFMEKTKIKLDKIWDAGRVLRIPGTWNHKPEYAKPIQSKIISDISESETEYTIKELDTILTREKKIIGENNNPVSYKKAKNIRLTKNDKKMIKKMFLWKDGRYKRLWDGHISDYSKDGNFDHSAVDMALLGRLYFLFGGVYGADNDRDKDFALSKADAAFRQTKLYRQKWDDKHYANGDTYGQGTLKKAKRDTIKFYDPATSKSDIYSSVIKEMNEKHAVVFIDGQVKIITEVYNPDLKYDDINFSNISDFKQLYLNQSIPLPNSEKKISKADWWLKSPDRLQYKGLVFAPDRTHKGYYNLWNGFSVKPKQGDWSLMKEHILEVISSGDEETAKWLLAWLARIFQKPGGDRPGTCPILRGSQGIGKGLILEQLGQIIGKYYINISNPDHIIGKFNFHLKNKILLFADESFLTDKKTAGILKGMITDSFLTIEAKNVNAFRIKNHINLIIASNNNQIIPAQMDERRFYVIDVSDKRKNDYAYFKKLKDQMDNGGREAMLYDLLEMDISGINLRTFPRTAALFDQIFHSLESVELYWFECLKTGYNLINQQRWDDGIINETHFKDYTIFTEQQKLKPATPSLFGKKIAKLCPSIRKARPTIDGLRPWTTTFPSLDVCRTEFENIIKIKLKWEEDHHLQDAA